METSRAREPRAGKDSLLMAHSKINLLRKSEPEAAVSRKVRVSTPTVGVRN